MGLKTAETQFSPKSTLDHLWGLTDAVWGCLDLFWTVFRHGAAPKGLQTAHFGTDRGGRKPAGTVSSNVGGSETPSNPVGRLFGSTRRPHLAPKPPEMPHFGDQKGVGKGPKCVLFFFCVQAYGQYALRLKAQ